LNDPPANAQKAITDLSCSAPVFFCHTFCVVFANAPQHIIFSIEIISFLSGQLKKIKSCPNAKKTKQKAASLQPPPPFRLCQKKNGVSYLT
jgi:hypothetical protein